MKVKDGLAEFAYGAGQIDPTSALQPGLIYDLSTLDYIRFLCNEGYTGTTLNLFTKDNTNCSSVPKFGGHDSLNYPTLYYQYDDPNSTISAIYYRTVTNVSFRNSMYKATVTAPKNLTVTVVPNKLSFTQLHQKKSFKVTLKAPPQFLQTFQYTHQSASLEWSDGTHRVKSPILISLSLPRWM